MKPAAFQYHAASSVDEAIATLAEVAPDQGRVLAGGQSLVPTMAFRLATPEHLVDINGIEELGRLAVDDGALSIGACVRHAAFHRPVTDDGLGALLTQVVGHIAHYPIRQRGTFCGSLAQADPASEWCLVAVTLGATIIAQSTRGRREIPASDFIEGVMTTTLEDDELLVEARLPLPAADTRFGFQEFSRRAGDFALASALAAFRLEDGVIRDARLGIGGAEDRPRRIAEAEAVLESQAPGTDTFEKAASVVAAALDPMEDAATTAQYRREVAQSMALRALESAAS
jgi:carbon-monoxide dehydrogenase medium subunit